jgi:hypothetical protein
VPRRESFWSAVDVMTPLSGIDAIITVLPYSDAGGAAWLAVDGITQFSDHYTLYTTRTTMGH